MPVGIGYTAKPAIQRLDTWIISNERARTCEFFLLGTRDLDFDPGVEKNINHRKRSKTVPRVLRGSSNAVFWASVPLNLMQTFHIRVFLKNLISYTLSRNIRTLGQ